MNDFSTVHHGVNEFPVQWEDPEDAQLCWALDPIRHPISPFEFSILPNIYINGFAAAARSAGMPFVSPRLRRINTYLYGIPGRLLPFQNAGTDGLLNGPFAHTVSHLAHTWENEILPEIRIHVAAWQAFDLDGASSVDLLQHLEHSIERATRLSELHFLILWPAKLVVSEFDELYRDLFEPMDPFAAYRLLSGLRNRSFAMGQALWELSRQVRADPAILAALELWQKGGRGLLQGTMGGRAFLMSLDCFLYDYGTRSDQFGLQLPSWIEDPTPIVAQIMNLAARGDEENPAITTSRLTSERVAAIQAARSTLRDYPRPIVEQFERLLRAAQEGIVIREDHEHYIDARLAYELRRVVLALGRQLTAAARLDTPDDVFMLTLPELHEALQPVALDIRSIVYARASEMEFFRAVQPPVQLGAAEPAEDRSDAFSRFMNKTEGEAQPRVEAGLLHGIAGSPGVARGPARIVHDYADAGRVGPGEVLVTETASSGWTTLFATAAAVVTDAGGVLGHCAVVAREYGIPAVVGTGCATLTLRDGETVEVDGTRGIVRRLESS